MSYNTVCQVLRIVESTVPLRVITCIRIRLGLASYELAPGLYPGVYTIGADYLSTLLWLVGLCGRSS